ncbi:MAG TPA: extracellular solute-binding protein [Chloroflexota bacterium]|nr:extracellular solute-binding protein [Chloroflexota bacterium]
MISHQRYNRRTVLKGAAAGAAALALPGEALAAPSRDVVHLEFWNPASDPTGKIIITNLVNGFNNTVGKANGIFVNSRIVPVPNEAAYVKYTTAMTSSGSPDVVMTYEYTPVGAWAGNGFIQPLDAYAKTSGIKEGDFFPIAWDMLNFGGHIWGLLQEFDFNQFWWNKQIHKGPPPKTIGELDALAMKYNKFDKKGNLIQAGIIPWFAAGGGYTTDWNALFGGSFYDHANGKWTINTPQNRKFLEWFLKYVHVFGGRSKADALASSTPTTYNAGDVLLWHKAAFGLEGEYIPPELKQLKNNLQYGIAFPPTGPGVPYGTNTTGGGNLFLLPTKCPHPKEAVTFIQYMGTKAVMAWCLPASNMAPTKAAVYSEQFSKTLPWIKPWVDTLRFNHMVPPASSPQSFLFATSMTTAIDEVTYLKKTPAQALAEVDQKVSRAVQQFKQFHPTWPTE